MKSIVNFKNSLLVVTLVLFTAGFTFKNVEEVKFYDPVGIWDYEVETGEETATGAMTISKKEDEFIVSIETDDFGTLVLEDVELKNTEMTGNVELEGDIIEFEFEFDGDTMEGVVVTPDGDLPIEAERRKEK